MGLFRNLLLTFCLLCLAGVSWAATLQGELGDRLETDRYDCILDLMPAKNLNSSDAVRIALESNATKDSLLVVLTRSSLTLYNVQDGKKNQITRVTDIGVTSGAAYHLTIMRRENTLGFLHDNLLLFRGAVPRGPGNLAAVTVDSGWTQTSEPRIQRLESVHFEDDFMRGVSENDPWAKQRTGTWKLKSAWDNAPHGNANAKYLAKEGYGQNPFAMVGCSKKDPGNPLKLVPAVLTTGEPFWEDYTFSVAVQPGMDDAVGMVFNMPDGNNGLLVRWTPAVDHGKPGKMVLSRVDNGKIIDTGASSPGGFLPGQWYQLTAISSLDGIRVLVDGVERIAKKGITPWRGGIGLYVEGYDGTVFDDVKVFGRTFDSDLLFETQQTAINKRMETDPNGMSNWADPKSEWTPIANTPGQFWYRHDVFGEHEWMALTVRPLAQPTGEIWMTLNSDGKNPTKGLRAVAQVTANPTKITYTLYHDEKVLASKSYNQPPTSDSDYSFRFYRVGSKLWLEVDGEPVVKATDTDPLAGLRPSYKAIGSFSGARDEVVLSHNLLDYSFSNAPTDWLNDGFWMSTIRWSCSPLWSFLAGWSRGDAVMWHKQRFSGDHSIEAFVGVKMEYPRERDIYDNRYRDFSLTICGDGHNPRSGYAATFATNENGLRRVVLLRNGVEVTHQDLSGTFGDLIPTRGNHRNWFDLELGKRGDTVTFTVTFAWMAPEKDAAGNVTGPRTLRLTYKDPNPIAGGVPAIWTTNNAISISRARISYMAQPLPRTDPQVSIDTPWYPEWMNVGKSLALSFPNSLSTTGKTVRFSAISRGTQGGGDESAGAIRIDGSLLTLTPRKADPSERENHWYEIKATDGENVSPSFHLDLHVFDPTTYNRDDSHALVLYRFDEEKGDTVHDRSAIAPASDLTIIAKTGESTDPNDRLTARWVPIQGLTLRDESRVMTKSGVDKLCKIQQSHACTIEMWISTDTIYPPAIPQEVAWISHLFSWDLQQANKDTQRNLSVLQQSTSLWLCPRDVPVGQTGNTTFYNGIRTGLAHIVIAWDGTKTTLYVNGTNRGEKLNIPWNVENMTKGSQLIIGNAADSRHPYLGTFYLFAIHDRAFTADDAKRHYLAGPSPR